jgi:hypothetical protein
MKPLKTKENKRKLSNLFAVHLISTFIFESMIAIYGAIELFRIDLIFRKIILQIAPIIGIVYRNIFINPPYKPIRSVKIKSALFLSIIVYVQSTGSHCE